MLGTLRKALGEDCVELILPDGADINQVIELLIGSYGGFDEVFLDSVMNSPLPNALILLDGVEIGNLKGLGTPLEDGSTLTLLPVTHGG